MTGHPGNTLGVVLYGQLIGTLNRISAYSEPTFTYLPEYVQNGAAPLTVRMPLSTETYPAKIVAPYLEGLLPENPATRASWMRALDADRDDPFTLLAAMGWDCPGAVQFAAIDDVEQMLTRRDEMTPLTVTDVRDRLAELRKNESSWTLPDEHWSLPGQQPKFALAKVDGQWFEAEGSAPTTHIIKPGMTRLNYQALVEHVTMRAAHIAGVDVADTRYESFDGEPAIVITRYDRIKHGDTGVLRIHQEDLCQATGRMPARKYESDGGPTAKDMMRVLRAVSMDLRPDAHALANFMIVNYVAGAPDGHSKNISLIILPNGRIQVAPLYDLASSFPYDAKNAELRKIALSIGGRRKFGEVMPKNWAKANDELQLPAGFMEQRAATMASVFPDAVEAAFDEVDSPAAGELRERMVPPLRRHCARLLDQLGDEKANTRTQVY